MIYIPYSGKFFAIYAIKRQLTKICSHKKFLLQKILPDKLRRLSTLSSSHRSRNSTKNYLFCHKSIEQTAINSPVIFTAANGSLELVHSLWHGSFFAGSNLHAFVSMFKYTFSFLKGQHFHAGKL